MSTRDRRDDRDAIRDLNDEFAYRLDSDDVPALLDLFTADAVYVSGDRRVTGRKGLEAYFRARTAAGPRTSRHMYSTLRISFDGPAAAHATSVWLSFVQNGAPPILSNRPFMVADFLDRYVLTAKGWRIADRRIVPVFRPA